MTQILAFLGIVLVSVCISVMGAFRDTYYRPAMAVFLSVIRAVGIIVLAALVFFWGWESTVHLPKSVTGLILLDEITHDKPAQSRSVSALLEKIQAQGGRPVLVTYNSQDYPPTTEILPWRRFSGFEDAILALKWLQERHGPIPVAVFSDHHPGSFITEAGGSWDITWIGSGSPLPGTMIQQVVYPEQVFTDQLFQVKVTVPERSGAMVLISGLNGTVIKKTPVEPGNKAEITVDLELKRAGYSSLELMLYDGDNNPVALERLPILALPRPDIIYISPYGSAAPLSEFLIDSGFDLKHLPPGQALLDPEQLEFEAEEGHLTLIIMDSVPLSYMRPVLAARLTDAVRRQGASMLFIPGADIGSGFRGNSLERLLPIHLGRPDEPDENENLAFVAIVDTSMSMFYTAGGSAGHGAFGPNPTGPASKIQMAKKALENLSSAIKEEDRFGILTVSDSPSWVMKPSAKRTPDAEVQLISRIYAMGPGINLYSGLLTAYNELVTIDAKIKHILIFLDTADVDEYEVADRGTVWELLEDFKNEGITISLVGFGKPDDQHIPQLNRFAEESGGYFYLTSELEEIPGFGLTDLQQVSDSPVTFQKKKVKFFQRDFTGIKSFPELKGQVITTLKPGAALYAWTDAKLPLYATWPYGKGRVGVFGADSGLFLARDWTAGTNQDAWLPLLLKLVAPDTNRSELFYSKGRDGNHTIFLKTDSTGTDEAYVAKTLLSNKSITTTVLDKVGTGKYVTHIEDPGTSIRSISVSDYENISSDIRVMPIPEQIQAIRQLPAGDFIPQPLENEDHPEPSTDPQALHLLILFALTLLVIDEFFRPPSMVGSSS